MPGFGSLAPGLPSTGDDTGLGAVDPSELASVLQKAGGIASQTWIGRLLSSALAPGRAVQGQYATAPSTPGQWSDEDEARRQLNAGAEIDDANNLGAFATGGAMPAVIARGVEGMASRPIFGSLAGAGALDRAPFYSAVERAAQASPAAKATGDQWLGTLRNTPGVKGEEINALGLGDLAGQGPVTKQDLLDRIAESKVQPRDVWKGGNATIEDPAIAEHVRNLREAGLNPEENPDDPGMVGFWDRANEDLLTTDEMRGFPPDLVRSAFAVERHMAGDGSTGASRYGAYVLPGGENYRELLMTLPEQKGAPTYESSHWPDDPNVLLHMRFNDRTLQQPGFAVQNLRSGNMGPAFPTREAAEADLARYPLSVQSAADIVPSPISSKALHLEELQSDWHQQGRRNGYGTAPVEGKVELSPGGNDYRVTWPDGTFSGGYGTPEAAQDAMQMRAARSVPDAPFKKTWPELGMKRAIAEAANNGYDALTWTPGEQQVGRYDLSQHVKEIEYIKNPDGTYKLGIADRDGEPIRNMPGIDVNRMTLDQIGDTVGKEIADKIQNGVGTRYRGHEGTTLDGLNLKVGGEGMHGFYDQMLPTIANKLGKKYGARVTTAQIPNPDARVHPEIARVNANLPPGIEAPPVPPSMTTVHMLPITPQLREAAKNGFPLFASGLPLPIIDPRAGPDDMAVQTSQWQREAEQNLRAKMAAQQKGEAFAPFSLAPGGQR